MSITVPANLNTNIANRSENWIVQLFNSSKTDSGANTSGSLYENQTSVNVTSGAAFNVADIISFGEAATELCKVTAINSNTLTLVMVVLWVQVQHLALHLDQMYISVTMSD